MVQRIQNNRRLFCPRVATAMTRGNAVVKIGLLHPVESLWLNWADEEHTGGIKKQLDENFQKVTEWLLFSHLDFDYLSESVMERIGSARGNELEVGSMKYSVVVVPGVKTIRRSTFEQLKSFVKNGGTVIFAGEVPGLIDAQPTNEVKEFSKECVCVSREQDSIDKGSLSHLEHCILLIRTVQNVINALSGKTG